MPAPRFPATNALPAIARQATALATLLTPVLGWAVTVPGDYDTVQEAVNSIGEGQSIAIEVSAGTTPDTEPIDIYNRTVTITSRTPGTRYTLWALIVDTDAVVDVTDADIRGDVADTEEVTGLDGIHAAVYVGWQGTFRATNSGISDVGDGAENGVYAIYSTEITLDTVTVSNFSGTGVKAYSGTVELDNCTISGMGNSGVRVGSYAGSAPSLSVDGGTFSGNVGEEGGDIGLMTALPSTIDNADFDGSEAEMGASIYIYDTDVTASSLGFTDTHATAYGGSTIKGGAIAVRYGSFSCAQCTITNSESDLYAGAVYGYGTTLSFTDGLFDHSSAGVAGAIYAYASTVDCESCSFLGTSSATDAGAVYLDASTGSFNGSTFDHTTSGGYGAVFVNLAERTGVGTALTCDDCTFLDNDAVFDSASVDVIGYANEIVSLRGATFTRSDTPVGLPEVLVSYVSLDLKDITVTGPALTGGFLSQYGGTASLEDVSIAHFSSTNPVVQLSYVESAEVRRALLCDLHTPRAVFFVESSPSEFRNMVLYSSDALSLVDAFASTADIAQITTLRNTISDAHILANESMISVRNSIFADAPFYGVYGLDDSFFGVGGYNLWPAGTIPVYHELSGYDSTGDLVGYPMFSTDIAPYLCPSIPGALPWLGFGSPAIDSGAPDILDPDRSASDRGALGGPDAWAWTVDYPDADGDGFNVQDDCDDQDPLIHPGAAPIEGSDANCDGLIEFIDDDADGFNRNDCDDTNPDVHPRAPEADNGLDDDCDGEIDEDFAGNPDSPPEDSDPLDSGTPGHPDADGDGSPDGVDCDDDNPAIHPGAEEIPENDVDEDCRKGATNFSIGGPGCGCDSSTLTPGWGASGWLGLGVLLLARRRRE